MNYLLRDKDFISTGDAFYQVLGYIHPPNYIVAIPRYLRTSYPTLWRNHYYYSRVFTQYSSKELKKIEADLLNEIFRYDPVLDSTLPQVKFENIRNAYLTGDWKKYLKKRDSLVERFYEIVEILKAGSNLGYEDFGLTGSMLIGIYNPIYSDIDLVVYGRKACEKLKEFIQSNLQFISRETSIIQGLDENSYSILARRKWSKCKYKNRSFSINPVKRYEEIDTRYGDFRVKNIKNIRAKVKIIEKIDPYFYPLRYRVTSDIGIEEFVIFEYYYMDLLEIGDEVEVHGLLQKVQEKNREYERLAYGVREVEDQYLHILGYYR
ncbi:MAG TPA: hypothetical protein VKU94_01475 [Geobacterales bacterium]|nr:hypothetical protein [Geobacterales bacterium]